MTHDTLGSLLAFASAKMLVAGERTLLHWVASLRMCLMTAKLET